MKIKNIISKILYFFLIKFYFHCFSIKYIYKTTESPRGEIGRHKGLKILAH